MAKTKNTSKFQNDIFHYSIIRELLRYFYLYGSSSIKELSQKGLITSSRTFYDIKKRIENYIDGQFLQEHKTKQAKSGKKFRLLYDPFLCPVNYLAETYQHCSYKIDDFLFYFCLMQAFTCVDPDSGPDPAPYEPVPGKEEDAGEDTCMDFDQEFTLKAEDLPATLSLVFEANQRMLAYYNGIKGNPEYSETLFTANKTNSHIDDLVDLGIIVETAKGAYRLSKDLFEELDADELSTVQLMTQFFYNCTFLTVPGYYLSATINSYSQAAFMPEIKSFFNKQENPVFQYKNHRLQSVIDDDITWKIINAIHTAESFHYFYKAKNKESAEYDILPMKIVIDLQYGRQYLFGYSYHDRAFCLPRIASIEKISTNEEIQQPRKYECIPSYDGSSDIHPYYDQLYRQYMENVWNTAPGDSVSTVTIHFTFPEPEYGKLLYRLRSTRHHGTISERGNGIVDFTVKTKNELELVPWIRSFGPYAKVDTQTNPELAAKLKTDFKEALEQYG